MFPTPQTLARTYNNPSYDDPWDAVEDYRRVQDAAAKHPEKGSAALSSVVDLPRGRIRAWVDNGGMPDAVRGINAALDHGWLDPNPNGATARALVELAAHVMAGGSIDERYVPAVSVGRRVDTDEIKATYLALDVRASIRHTDSKNRADEVLPRDDASVLGRCLITMGIPQGSKRDVESLPPVARTGSRLHRTLFATVYAQHRAVDYEGKDTTRVMETRPRVYLDELGGLFSEVTTDPVSVDDRGVTLSAAAARELGLAKQVAE